MKKLLDRILEGYISETLEIQKKAKILAIINILIFCSMVSLLPITIIIRHTLGFIILLLTSIIQIVSLAFIKKNKYKIASNILLIFILFGNTGSVISNLFSTNMTDAEIYVYGFLLIFLIIEACLISYSKWQIVMVTVFCICGVLLMYFFRVLPHAGGKIDMDNIKPIIIVPFMLLTAGFIGWLILGITKQLIQVAETEAILNEKRYKRIETIMISTKKGMEIGQDLISSSKNTSLILEKIENFLASIKIEVNNLRSVIDISQRVNVDVFQSTDNVKVIIDEQNSAISESSSAIHEMMTSINSISDIMKIKKEHVSQLLDSTNITENEIKQSIDLINGISKSSDKINEIIESIINISKNIDLLSMNAAIEAAHAGDYGKGFNVVAEEIKRLAEDSGENINQITETLNTNIKEIKFAERINDNTGRYFQKLASEIGDLINSIEEMSSGLTELSNGTHEIINAVEDMVTSSGKVINSMNEMAGKVNESIDNFTNLDVLYDTIQQKIEEINNYFKQINIELSSVNEIGEKNIEHIKYMDNEIRKTKEEIT